MAHLYRLRWRIEILFKAWKSKLGLSKLKDVGARQIEVLVYGLLTVTSLLHRAYPIGPNPPKVLHDDETSSTLSPPVATHSLMISSPLSILKFTELIAVWIPLLIFADLSADQLYRRLHLQIRAHCRYESKRFRLNHHQIRSICLKLTPMRACGRGQAGTGCAPVD